MAYQRGSAQERLSLAERFKRLARSHGRRIGTGLLITYGLKGLGFGYLAGFPIGTAVGLAYTAWRYAQPRSPAKRKATTRRQGKAVARRAARAVGKAAKAGAKRAVSAAMLEARRRFGQAAKQVIAEGLRVGTKEFGRRMKELMS